VLPHLAPQLVECCRFTEADEMQVEETSNNDINVYRGDYYESHDVEYVDPEGQENELEGITL